jgi:hypothetical protein
MNTDIPALSLRQPWLWAILFAGKTVENRIWRTEYRGRIRLHASKTWDDDGETYLSHQGLIVPNYFVCRDKGWLGAYLGEVSIVDCGEFFPCLGHEHHPWAFGPVCWILADPVAYAEPIPGRGYPGLFYPEKRSP